LVVVEPRPGRSALGAASRQLCRAPPDDSHLRPARARRGTLPATRRWPGGSAGASWSIRAA